MDPVTSALVIGAATGVTTAATQTVAQPVMTKAYQAYEALKGFLKQKFGPDSFLLSAVNMLEQKPDYEPCQKMVADEVKATQAHQDPDILQAAKELLSLLDAEPSDKSHIQTNVVASKYVAVSGTGTAILRVNDPKE